MFVKKILLFAFIILFSLSLFSCSWDSVTITPSGTPVTPSGSTSSDSSTEPLTSSGTYGLTYDEGLDFYTVSGYQGTEADVFIPAEFNGKPVTGINSYAFYENETVETITITSTVTLVASQALVGNYKVFCETEADVCGDEDCSRIHPDGWHKNWYDKSADPEYVEWGCGSFGSFSWTCNKDDEIIINGYIANPVSLNIPAKIGKRTVVAIAKDAFVDCTSLESISLPDTIEKIGSFAFRNCTSLKSVALPSGVTVISSYMFEGCTSLEEVTISSETTEIGSSAFANCTSLIRIDIPKTVKTVGSFAFLKDVKLEIHFLGFDSPPSGWDKNWNSEGGTVKYELSEKEE